MHKNKFVVTVAIFVLSALVFATIFALTYHVVRTDANSPQIQYARNAALSLSKGIEPSVLIPANLSIDLDKDLDVFATIYDAQGKIVVSSAVLRSNKPVVPFGVLEHARLYGENRVTWEPEKGVRTAIVAVPYTSTSTTGYVVIGRSLREIEGQQIGLLKIAGLGWAVSLAVISLLIYFL